MLAMLLVCPIPKPENDDDILRGGLLYAVTSQASDDGDVLSSCGILGLDSGVYSLFDGAAPP